MIIYHVEESTIDHSGTFFYEPTSSTLGYYRGVTEFPNAENNPSPDNDVWILFNAEISDKNKALNISHELFGHAFLYDINGNNAVGASHNYKNSDDFILEYDETLNMYFPTFVIQDMNTILQEYIKQSQKETTTNFDK